MKNEPNKLMEQLNVGKTYCEEMARENARLTIRHEADQQAIRGLKVRVKELEEQLQEEQLRNVVSRGRR